MRLQRHRNIEVGDATLECTLYGSGVPVLLLANAGCSTGYFDDLTRVLAAGGLQTISVNMRGAGESRGSLDEFIEDSRRRSPIPASAQSAASGM